jgi:hypothetical protein
MLHIPAPFLVGYKSIYQSKSPRSERVHSKEFLYDYILLIDTLRWAKSFWHCCLRLVSCFFSFWTGKDHMITPSQEDERY